MIQVKFFYDLSLISDLCGMKLLIVAATDRELEAVKRYVDSHHFSSIKLLVTGVGAIASCFSLTEAAGNELPEMIIQIGIGGSFSSSLAIGSAVAVDKEVIADMGVIEEDGYKSIFEMGLINKDAHPYSNGALANTHCDLIRMSGLRSVIGLTVNEITTHPEKISIFNNQYRAEIESMEGAALHYVCIMKKIPFLQIRGISNMVGERDKSKWKINEAINAASDACVGLINNLMTKS